MPYHINQPTNDKAEVSDDGSSSSSDSEGGVIEGIPWLYHPLRAFLLGKLQQNDFPADYKLMAPFDVWNKYCDDDVFEGMEYDAAFRRRLLALRKQFQQDNNRANDDFEAFQIAKRNNPAPEINSKGEPQWNGSDAQRLLEIDIDNKKHKELKPEELWGSRDEYQEFFLSTFGDHIYQSVQTRKYLHTLKLRDKEKETKRKKKAAKKLKAQKVALEREKVKAAKEEEKKRKAAKKEEEKRRKAIARAEEKQRKAAEKEEEKNARQKQGRKKENAKQPKKRKKKDAKP